MAGRPKGLTKTGGRKKGTPNKLTKTAKEMLGEFIEGQFHNVPSWFEEIEDPAKKVGLFIRFLEFYIPKMRSTEFLDVPDLATFVLMSPEERQEKIKLIKEKLGTK